MPKLLIKVKYWLPLLIYCGIIFYLSSLPAKELEDLRIADKIAHLLEYFLLGFLAIYAFKNTLSFSRIKQFCFVIVFSVIFAFFDEAHQYFVPGRQCSFLDFAFDMCGVILSLLLFSDFKRTETSS